ncbi:hypothetical protein PUN28_005052 [Cardiocondyla obscurior]|uniref:Uncharacterized protein n=1 Tax=Cardiocondyla obscurior TaxID=286306 RepID=A0AAW2GFL3_9HYME
MLHQCLVYCIGFITVWSIGLSLIIYLTHMCALLKLTSYRIENVFEKNILAISNPKRKQYLLHQRIVRAVVMHRRAIEFSNIIMSSFNVPYCIILILGVLSLSVNFFRLLRAIMMQNMYQLIASTLFIIFHFLFLFLGNYYGQKITDCNNEVFYTVYNVQWYDAPVKIQKLFLFIMQNTTTPYILNIGNLIFASVEGFFKLVSMSMSYFTVIYTLM